MNLVLWMDSVVPIDSYFDVNDVSASDANWTGRVDVLGVNDGDTMNVDLLPKCL